ncbi:hypothetical protein AVEN_274934-1 [Araneus ventricosus]|uniref:Uncharacterized protein n=1 Tax=Araneus ventricosus TaxID=182803 RepID=A0A4Y2S4E8_ARAVE|nr:hypothetical protein AVEN_274934-1 [Araneus ventricosus]
MVRTVFPIEGTDRRGHLWSLRSPDTSYIALFLGYSSLVYETPVESEAGPASRISAPHADLHKNPGVLEGVINSPHCRCEGSIEVVDPGIEHFR